MKLGWTVLPHLPYSLDLVPTDYYLFSVVTKLFDGGDSSIYFSKENQIEDFVENPFHIKSSGILLKTYWMPGHQSLQIIVNNSIKCNCTFLRLKLIDKDGNRPWLNLTECQHNAKKIILCLELFQTFVKRKTIISVIFISLNF